MPDFSMMTGEFFRRLNHFGAGLNGYYYFKS